MAHPRLPLSLSLYSYGFQTVHSVSRSFILPEGCSEELRETQLESNPWAVLNPYSLEKKRVTQYCRRKQVTPLGLGAPAAAWGRASVAVLRSDWDGESTESEPPDLSSATSPWFFDFAETEAQKDRKPWNKALTRRKGAQYAWIDTRAGSEWVSESPSWQSESLLWGISSGFSFDKLFLFASSWVHI